MTCPICKSHEPCAHLVLAYDATFLQVNGGELYNEINKFKFVLEQRIDHAVQHGEHLPEDLEIPSIDTINELIAELIEEIESENLDPEDCTVDSMRTRAFSDLFFKEIIGQDELIFECEEDFEGGPGSSSLNLLYFCRDPEQFRKALDSWTLELKSRLPLP